MYKKWVWQCRRPMRSQGVMVGEEKKTKQKAMANKESATTGSYNAGGGKICQPISESNENASRPNVLSIYCGQNYHKMAKAVFRFCLFHTRLHQQQP